MVHVLTGGIAGMVLTGVEGAKSSFFNINTKDMKKDYTKGISRAMFWGADLFQWKKNKKW
jgi:hypothetical protein